MSPRSLDEDKSLFACLFKASLALSPRSLDKDKPLFFACPFGATFVNTDNGQVLKCDLCDGDPTCVKVCPTEAITCEEITKEAYLKLMNNAECIPQLVKQALGEE